MGTGPRLAGTFLILLSFAPIARGESDRDAMLRAIYAFPNENTPRLVYADLIEELGKDKMAAFIRADVELARGWEGEELKEKTKARNEALRAAMGEWTEGWKLGQYGRPETTPDYSDPWGIYRPDYIRAFGGGSTSTGLYFERGMPKATIALREFSADRLAEVIQSLPREVHSIEILADLHDPEKMAPALEAVAKRSADGFVTELTFGGRDGIAQLPEIFAGLGRFPAEANIRKLRFRWLHPEVADLQALAQSPMAKKLEELHMPRPENRAAFREFFLAHRHHFPEMHEKPAVADMTRGEWAAGRRTWAGICLRGMRTLGRAVSIPFSGLVR